MSDRKYLLNNRVWLNPPTSPDSGAIHSLVFQEGSEGFLDASLSIWDCGKKITLDFYCCLEDEEWVKQRAEKIDILIEELIKFKVALGACYDLALERFEGDLDE